MITTVQFLSVPVSRAAGENYTKDLMTGATVTVVHSFDNATVTEDLDQVLVVPYFNGYSNCNMVAFNDCYYWILSAVTSTKYAKSLEFVITFNATASMVTLGDRLAGKWERTPTYNGLQENIFNTEMSSVSIQPFTSLETLPKLTKTSVIGATELTYQYQMFWCQITCKGSGNDSMSQYGLFFLYSPEAGLYGESLPYASKTTNETYYFPTLDLIINQPEDVLPIGSGEEIVDISYTTQCPYAMTIVGTASGTLYELTTVIENIDPVVTEELAGKKYCVYSLLGYAGYIQDAYENTYTPTPSEAVRNCGYIELKDSSGNTLYTMPGNNPKPIVWRAVSDLSGVYIVLKIGADKCITVPQGKLPWQVGSWSQYQAYSQTFDRQLMESQIRAAKEGMVAGLAESAINGVVTGALVGVAGGPAGVATGVATGLVGAASTVYSQYVNEEQARRTQQINEKRAFAQPDTFINAGYGLMHGSLSLIVRNSLAINYLLPVNYTAQMDASYHLQYGYNAGGTTNIYQIRKGYWQGLLFKQSTLKGERLVNEFMNGQIIG